jgi:hypothetical protein
MTGMERDLAVHGPHDPVLGTPPRVPGSVRRTSTVDTSFPEGVAGPRRVDARARDLRTEADGTATVLDAVRLDVVLESAGAVRSIRAVPPDAGAAAPDTALDALVGVSVHTGFRRAVDAALPDLVDSGSLRYLLLDDLPGASLVAGVAFQHAIRTRGTIPVELLTRMVDICAGWAHDAAMPAFIRHEGFSPPVVGPPAPVLEPADDPLAWHPAEPVPPQGSRRRRRLDLVPDGDLVHVDVHFRDSHVDPDGAETVVHEYTVALDVDPATATIVRAEAGPRVLPWHECPTAAASAGRLAGQTLSGLRRHVRSTFVGTTTCTHLNDTLRGLADLPLLLAVLPPPGR